MTLTIKDCKATPNRITVVFSEAVKADSTTATDSATNPANYRIQQISPKPDGPIPLTGAAAISYDATRNAIRIRPFIPTSSGTIPIPWPWALLTSESWIGLIVSNVAAGTGPDKIDGPFPKGEAFPTRVDGDDDPAQDARRTARAVEDAVAYPVLTEEVGYPPSPLATPSAARPGSPGGTSLGQTVMSAVGDVLGWKVKAADPKGFVGALTASFACTDVEGHTQCTWTPRTYAVQTDLAGGITGAQASLYSRAQEALNQALPLLDGLYPLDPEADAEDVTALKGIARSQLTELVNELGVAGGPRISRINQYFQLLLQDGPPFPPKPVSSFVTEPDDIKGTLGKLRDELGLKFSEDFVNTVQDEQDVTNFRILSDYVTSLAQSWINNLDFFGLKTDKPFFGTQLVLLSRQLSVVSESVDEVRFALDSVFIGPAERQTLKLDFGPDDEPLFAEDLFNWVQSFATEEGPRLIQDGGKYAVQFSFLPVARQLQGLVKTAHDRNGEDHGFRTFRVQRALQQLRKELDELVTLAEKITHLIQVEPTKTDLNTMRTLLLSPPSTLLAFPPQLSFLDEDQLPLTIFNIGAISVTIPSAITVQGPNASDFKLVEPHVFPITLPRQSTLAISVAFIPSGTGDNVRNATLNVSYNGGALSIPLVGRITADTATPSSTTRRN
jgi:hypothetical protein